MTASASAFSVDPRKAVIGSLVNPQGVVPFDPVLERTRDTWTAGDFGRIAATYASGAADFVNRLPIAPGTTLLDVACGTGNLTLPAARRGALVTGIDIAPNLVAAARTASLAASLDIRFDIGAAEALPYGDGTFDVVMSMFGVMFSARPGEALSELLRVTRSGGHVALASWSPQGFVGSMLRAHTARVPPPAGAQSPLAWGDPAVLRERLDQHAACIQAIRIVPRTIVFTTPLTPGGVVELFRECYGPSVRTFGALDADGRAALAADLLRLWDDHNTAGDGGTSVTAEYLEALIEVR